MNDQRGRRGAAIGLSGRQTALRPGKPGGGDAGRSLTLPTRLNTRFIIKFGVVVRALDATPSTDNGHSVVFLGFESSSAFGPAGFGGGATSRGSGRITGGGKIPMLESCIRTIRAESADDCI